MKTQSILMLSASALAGLFLSACGGGGEGDEMPASEDTGTASIDIPSELDGKLIAAENDEIVEAELTGDPEYYVFYHSASW